MKNLAVANALALSPHALEAIPPGSSALQRVGEYARALPGVEKALLLIPPEAAAFAAAELPAAGLKLESCSAETAGDLVKCLKSLSSGYDNIFYFFADCPLLDGELSARMLENHRRYFADYTFADGYPYGLSPEILKPSLLAPLAALAEGSTGDTPIAARERGALFELIKKDINAFDIETELSPVDLRLLRARLCADSRGNLLLVRRLVEAGAGRADSVCSVLQEKAEILRTLPAFFNIQIVEGCPQLCSYCPYPRFGIRDTGKQAEMPLARFEELLDRIVGFCEDATVGVSLWGEPSYHSRFAELAAAVSSRGLRLIVETSGVGWQQGVFDQIARAGLPQIDWIVSLDSRDAGEYRALRGEGFEEAQAVVDTLAGLFPGRVHPQTVRMKENEEGLETFYRHWKSRTGRVIVQKYDSFCGFLPDRRVTDLSPLKRFPCWHLKRDLAVLLDGSVCLCREDLKREHSLGNLFTQSLEEVWSAGEPYYRDHIREGYPDLCSRCDEYYSFNF